LPKIFSVRGGNASFAAEMSLGEDNLVYRKILNRSKKRARRSYGFQITPYPFLNSLLPPARRGSVVDVPAMPEAYHQHHEFLVLNPAQEAVVLDTIAPELTEIPFETLAEQPGIITTRHAGIEERKDPP
jgi:hypothetical protein